MQICTLRNFVRCSAHQSAELKRERDDRGTALSGHRQQGFGINVRCLLRWALLFHSPVHRPSFDVRWKSQHTDSPNIWVISCLLHHTWFPLWNTHRQQVSPLSCFDKLFPGRKSSVVRSPLAEIPASIKHRTWKRFQPKMKSNKIMVEFEHAVTQVHLSAHYRGGLRCYLKAFISKPCSEAWRSTILKQISQHFIGVGPALY